VAEVDAGTVHGNGVCAMVELKIFPTIKYGTKDLSTLKDYDGPGDYDTLLAFIHREFCSPFHLDLCDSKSREQIEEFQDWGLDRLETKIANIKREIATIEDDFELELAKLQLYQNEITAEKTRAMKAIEEDLLATEEVEELLTADEKYHAGIEEVQSTFAKMTNKKDEALKAVEDGELETMIIVRDFLKSKVLDLYEQPQYKNSEQNKIHEKRAIEHDSL